MLAAKRVYLAVGGVLTVVVVLGGAALFFGILGRHPTLALDSFNAEYSTKDTRLDTCAVCHTTGRLLNLYGADVRRQFDSAMTSRKAKTEAEKIESFRLVIRAIEGRDTDGDGFSNLAEISARTFPGDPADRPGAP